MTNDELDERRARVIRIFFPHQPDIWIAVAKNAARAIRASDEAAGMVMVPREALTKLVQLTNEQAEDDMLWFHAVTITESYLQQELRTLTAFVEDMLTASPYTEKKE